MVTYESGFGPQDPPEQGVRRSAFVDLNKTKEGLSYGADECLSDFASLDRLKAGADAKGESVYMNIDGVWHYVLSWDSVAEEVNILNIGVMKADANRKFIVTSKERHLTKVR